MNGHDLLPIIGDRDVTLTGGWDNDRDVTLTGGWDNDRDVTLTGRWDSDGKEIVMSH